MMKLAKLVVFVVFFSAPTQVVGTSPVVPFGLADTAIGLWFVFFVQILVEYLLSASAIALPSLFSSVHVSSYRLTPEFSRVLAADE
jgi:thiamine transporter ThiT